MSAGVSDEKLAEARTLHRGAQLRWDFVAAENSTGFHSPQGFTFEDPQVVRIKSHSLEVVQENCVGCHMDTVATTFLAAPESRRCTTCHPGMGHAL